MTTRILKISESSWLRIGRRAGWTRTAAEQHTSSQCYKLTTDGQGGIVSYHIWRSNAQGQKSSSYGKWQGNWSAELSLHWIYDDVHGFRCDHRDDPQIISVWSNFDGLPPEPDLEAKIHKLVLDCFKREMFYSDLKSYLDRYFYSLEDRNLPAGHELDNRSEPIRHSLRQEYEKRARFLSNSGRRTKLNLATDVADIMNRGLRKMMREHRDDEGNLDSDWQDYSVQTMLGSKVVSWAVERATKGADRWAADRAIDSNVDKIEQLANQMATHLPYFILEKPYLLELLQIPKLRQLGDERINKIFDMIANTYQF
jgi:hypothetical protein